jgi:beta-lactamase regulating signal transducer with metallopeptidase domain
LTVAGSLIGLLAERLTRVPRVREVAWGVVFVLPLLFFLLVMGERLVEMLAPTPLAGNAMHVSVTLGTLTLTSASAPGVFEALLARPETVLVAWAVLGLSLAGAVARVSVWFAGRQRLAHVVRRAKPLSPLAPGRVPTLVSEEIDRPMLAGVRHPAILIPAAAARTLDSDGLRLIGLHELAHLRRGDNLRRPLEEALLGLFWLTPPLGFVRAQMAAAMEEACDDQALRGADEALRRVYARTLVETLRLGAGPEHAPAFIGANRRSRLMRMNSILNPARPARPSTVVALGAVVAALAAVAGLSANAAVAAADGAQSQPPAKPTFAYSGLIKSPIWVSQPKGEDFVTNFPAKALAAGIEGRSKMSCRVKRDGTLNACRVVSETPQGQGFGAAELKLAQKFRMQSTTADGRPVSGRTVMIPILWKAVG